MIFPVIWGPDKRKNAYICGSWPESSHVKGLQHQHSEVMIKENYKQPRAESFPVEPERTVCQSLDEPDLEGWNNDEELVW